MNIYQRINAVRKAISYIRKDKDVSAGAGGNYKAVTHDAVTGMVRAHLIEHGVVIVPSVVAAVFHPTEEGKKQRLYEATYQIEFVNIDAPDEKVCMQITAHALDNGDKAPGKAISYATKYAILKLFNIETGEDEESRYQTTDFDTDAHVEAMMNCKTKETLQAAWESSYALAEKSGDKEAMKTIIAAKNARLKAIKAIETAGQA